MNVSGILVMVPRFELERTVASLSALPGVEVHHTHPPTGRIIVTQEAESVSGEIAGLERIQALPHVILAEMVHHHFDEELEESRDERATS